MQTTSAIFDRYQEIKQRLPQTSTQDTVHDISSLLDISETVSAFVFDAFGVLNVGETLIPGADHRLNQLCALG
ncbi:MAG: haloacid dehalogenase, partial [Rhodobacterales bacterium]